MNLPVTRSCPRPEGLQSIEQEFDAFDVICQPAARPENDPVERRGLQQVM